MNVYENDTNQHIMLFKRQLYSLCISFFCEYVSSIVWKSQRHFFLFLVFLYTEMTKLIDVYKKTMTSLSYTVFGDPAAEETRSLAATI